MIKKIISVGMCIFFGHLSAYASPSFGKEGLARGFNQTIGYQAAFDGKVTHSIAYQGNIMFFNYGYSYQFDVGNKLYVGVSTFSLPSILMSNAGLPTFDLSIDVRLQYGRIFSNNENLLKVSFDTFLAPLVIGDNGLASYSTIGVFVEKNFGKNLPMNGYSFGISLNWSIWDIFIIKDKSRKYFRKYEK